MKNITGISFFAPEAKQRNEENTAVNNLCDISTSPAEHPTNTALKPFISGDPLVRLWL
jgi:hypothetical protein